MKIKRVFVIIPVLVFYTKRIRFNIGLIVCIPEKASSKHAAKETQLQIVHAKAMIKFPILHSYKYRTNPHYRLQIEATCYAIDISYYPPCKQLSEAYKRADTIHMHHNLQNTFSKNKIKTILLAKLGIPHIQLGTTVNT